MGHCNIGKKIGRNGGRNIQTVFQNRMFGTFELCKGLRIVAVHNSSQPEIPTCHAGGDEAGNNAASECPDSQGGQVTASVGSHGANATQLDTNGAQVGKTTQRIGRDDL